MSIFDFWEKGKTEQFDIKDIVQQMFDEAGILPQCPDENVFMTVIDGVHGSFKTILQLTERILRNFLYLRYFLCQFRGISQG